MTKVLVASATSYLSQEDKMFYQIKIEGHLDSHWTEWFEGLTITYDKHGNSLLSGSITDQAAQHGLLNKIRDMKLALISVNRIEANAKQGLAQL